ncbi:nitroreductase family protein [Candidatus Aerophobetes bacterium]|nr:nitroreductase family protein [Candidatus Aerophobetes bacterium]
MDVMEAIEKRTSVRAYQDKPIPEETLKKILKAARLAPSARNAQPYKYIVVKDARMREKLANEATPYHFIGEAPVILVAVALQPDYVMRCEVPAYAVDVGIAFDHVTLVAVEEGLGTCWIGAFYQKPAKQILNIPEKYKVVAILPVGYPADGAGKKSRKSLNELVCYDTFTE